MTHEFKVGMKVRLTKERGFQIDSAWLIRAKERYGDNWVIMSVDEGQYGLVARPLKMYRRLGRSDACEDDSAFNPQEFEYVGMVDSTPSPEIKGIVVRNGVIMEA